jgi:hypothetical protein
MFTRNQIIEAIFRPVEVDAIVLKGISKRMLRLDEQDFIKIAQQNGIHLVPVIKNRYFIK